MEESNYWARLYLRRMSRRSLLTAGGTVALGAATAAVVGCGGGGDEPNGSPTPAGGTAKPTTAGWDPVSGGKVTQGRLLSVLGIDPHVDLTGLDIVPRIYTYLYAWQPFNETAIFNNFATSLEIPDRDGLEFILKLRPGIMVQPQRDNPAAGEELTSADVKSSFIRRTTSITAIDKRFGGRIVGKHVADEPSLQAALQTPDPYTFTFKMKTPFVPSVREMSNPTWAMIPQKVTDKFGLGLSQSAYGSGPFMLTEFRGYERIKLQRHPNFWLKPRPYLDSITYIVITEASSLLAAFDSGEHDINGAILTRKQGEDRQKDSRFVVVKVPTRFYPVIHFKTHKTLPFGDIKVREAIDLGLDRDEMIKVIWDGEGQYNGPVQYLMKRFSLPQAELREAMPYDPERARKLLADAGYPNGFQVKMKLPRVPGAPFIADLSSLIKDQLQKIKIDLLLDEVELGTFIANTILPGNFEMAFFPNLPYDEPDRPLSFYHSRGVTGGGNWNNYQNAAIDRLIDEQSQEFNDEKRVEIIHKVQRLILKEHGPQITMPGGNFYSARWNYVHFPFEFSGDPGTGILSVSEDPLKIGAMNLGPDASDLWSEEGA